MPRSCPSFCCRGATNDAPGAEFTWNSARAVCRGRDHRVRGRPARRDRDGAFTDSDCNDADARTHPGAVDMPDNGIDEDCSSGDFVNVDRDGDGFARPGDCDDADAAVRPAAPEVPGNVIDENCNRAERRVPADCKRNPASLGVHADVHPGTALRRSRRAGRRHDRDPLRRTRLSPARQARAIEGRQGDELHRLLPRPVATARGGDRRADHRAWLDRKGRPLHDATRQSPSGPDPLCYTGRATSVHVPT
jgi:hypothetical protein